MLCSLVANQATGEHFTAVRGEGAWCDASRPVRPSIVTEIENSVIALNGPVDRALAERLHELFVEVLIAPGYQQDALEILTTSQKLAHRLAPELIAGGLAVQFLDALLHELLHQVGVHLLLPSPRACDAIQEGTDPPPVAPWAEHSSPAFEYGEVEEV